MTETEGSPDERFQDQLNRSARLVLEGSGHAGCSFLGSAYLDRENHAVVCGCGVFLEPPADLVTTQEAALAPADPISSTLALIDPTKIYTPVEVEYHILDVVSRLETGALFERECILAAGKAQADYNRLFFATIHTSQQTSELKRKAEAEVACEEAGLTAARDEAAMMAAAIKATMHNLRAILSGYQSTSRSVQAAYQAGGSPGRQF